MRMSTPPVRRPQSAALAEIKASTSKLAEQFDSVSAGGNALLTEAMA